jgi:hypothetical protein
MPRADRILAGTRRDPASPLQRCHATRGAPTATQNRRAESPAGREGDELATIRRSIWNGRTEGGRARACAASR